MTDERFRPWLTDAVYLPTLTLEALADLDGLYVPEGSNHRELLEISGTVREYLDRGGTVLAFGDHPVTWLPGLTWELCFAVDEPKLMAGAPDFGFHRAVPMIDRLWHHHGVLRPPSGADSLLATEDGASVLYVDRATTNGTLLISTLDPIQHCSGRVIPEAPDFLNLFLPWIVNELL